MFYSCGSRRPFVIREPERRERCIGASIFDWKFDSISTDEIVSASPYVCGNKISRGNNKLLPPELQFLSLSLSLSLSRLSSLFRPVSHSRQLLAYE